MIWLLLLSVIVISTCGIIYELIAGTLASYLLGDSVLQFSTIIGTYLFSMGIGSYTSKFIKNNLLEKFIVLEYLIGVIGGCSSILLFLLFHQIEAFRFLLYFLVGLTGFFVGAEIPLVIRLLKNKINFTDLISNVFALDYVGALLASVIFPLWLVPSLGLGKTSLLFGIVNIMVAILVYKKLSVSKTKQWLFATGILLLTGMGTLFYFSNSILNISEEYQFGEHILYSHNSNYQRIVVTRNKHIWKLFLNNNLQFSTADEYRYHESLVHPALSRIQNPHRILVLGGGDGMAAREMLKYPNIEKITLVDLDKSMTDLFSKNNIFNQLNNKSLQNNKVEIINTDAFQFIKNCKDSFDFICIDFPDPSNFSLGKLYSHSFFQLLNPKLKTDGLAVIQCTSPAVAPNSFWCIDKTIRSASFNTLPYHTLVPSFGDWGFILFTHEKGIRDSNKLPADLKFFDELAFKNMLYFPKDMQSSKSIVVNELQNQSLVNYFESEWGKF